MRFPNDFRVGERADARDQRMSMRTGAVDQIGDSSFPKLPQRCVGGEPAAAARVFGVPVNLIAGVFGVGKVDGSRGHGGAMGRGIGDECVAAVVGNVEPLVPVGGPGVGLVRSGEVVAKVGAGCGPEAEGSVDVDPGVVPVGDGDEWWRSRCGTG